MTYYNDDFEQPYDWEDAFLIEPFLDDDFLEWWEVE